MCGDPGDDRVEGALASQGEVLDLIPGIPPTPKDEDRGLSPCEISLGPRVIYLVDYYHSSCASFPSSFCSLSTSFYESPYSW